MKNYLNVNGWRLSGKDAKNVVPNSAASVLLVVLVIGIGGIWIISYVICWRSL